LIGSSRRAIVRGSDAEEEPRAPLRALRWLWHLARPYAGRLAFALLSMIVTGAIGLLVPMFAGRAVDAVLIDKSTAGLRQWIFDLIGLFVVVAVLDFAEGYVLRATATRLLRELRARLHGHLLTLTPVFFERERVGELLSRLSDDISTIGDVLTREMISGTQQTLTLVGALALMFATSSKLTLVMLIAVPPIAIAAVLFGARFEKLSEERQKRLAAASVAAEESLAGIRTVQAFVREGEERRRYGLALERVLELGLKLARIWGAYNALVTLLAFTAITLVIWYGATLMLANELTPGQLMAFVLYTVTAASSIASITGVWAGLKSAAGSTQRVRELLETQAVVLDAPTRVRSAECAARSASSRCASPIPPSRTRPALDGVSIEALPGEVVALVGPSGGGKSTLASLLLRFHDPQRGAVLVDGLDIRHVTLASLREAIGYVSQEIFLFGGTVAENLRYGKLDASDESCAAPRATRTRSSSSSAFRRASRP
jgi:ABC-type multidrug transport system fused ATPase/permease subunit